MRQRVFERSEQRVDGRAGTPWHLAEPAAVARGRAVRGGAVCRARSVLRSGSRGAARDGASSERRGHRDHRGNGGRVPPPSTAATVVLALVTLLLATGIVAVAMLRAADRPAVAGTAVVPAAPIGAAGSALR